MKTSYQPISRGAAAGSADAGNNFSWSDDRMNLKGVASFAPRPAKRLQKTSGLPELDFEIERAEPARAAAIPTLLFRLRIRQRAGAAPMVPIHCISLHCQLRIDVTQREYDSEERAQLAELVSDREHVRRTLGTLLWTRAHVDVGPFQSVASVDLSVPCSMDFNLAATRYFNGLESGAVPLLLLFSGSVIYRGRDGGLAVGQIPWSAEARFDLPVRIWRDLMQRYYPNQVFVAVERPVYYALSEYKRQNSHEGFGESIESLLRRPAGPASRKNKGTRSV